MERTTYIETIHLNTIKTMVDQLRERRLIGPKATSTNTIKHNNTILEK